MIIFTSPNLPIFPLPILVHNSCSNGLKLHVSHESISPTISVGKVLSLSRLLYTSRNVVASSLVECAPKEEVQRFPPSIHQIIPIESIEEHALWYRMPYPRKPTPLNFD